jgi:nitrogen fixation/metabolism regulation signal transduction histidine kinase
MTKHLKALLIAIIVLGVVLLAALALATRNTASFAYNYSTLLYLNVAVIFLMSGLLLVLAYWLFKRLRSNVFGTRLLTRFALSFVLLAVVPSVLLFLISNLFISRTINSWFSLKLDGALTAGIDFGRDRLLLNRDITQEQLARLVTQHNFSTAPNKTEAQAILKQNNWQTIIGLDSQGKITWRIDAPEISAANITEHLPEFAPDLLQPINQNWVQIEDEADSVERTDVTVAPRQYIHAIQTIAPITSPTPTHWVYAQKIMPADFSTRVNDIQNGLRDYQATETSRESLRNLYRVTLAIVLLVTLLAALAAAFLIANRMIQPILWLAQATRQVAAGHYALVPQRVQGSDEMLQLVDSFGEMAQKLSVTQSSLTHNQQELESAKAYSEAVLDNLSSGVLVFNQNLKLLSYNHTAKRMFQTEFKQYTLQHLHQIEPLAPLIEIIESQIKHAHESTDYSWRIQHPFANPAAPLHDEITLSMQGSRFLAENNTYSWVLVCDDVTPIISAQRTLAWGEVARRLAHEIKNPLTPIQLSAERLSMKLASKLDQEGQIQLERSTRTIINQVSALQNMVDEFRDYARTPEVVFTEVNLNALIDEILVLYESGQNQKYRIHTKLAALPPIWADAQQLRQVLHNLIKNSIEAHPQDTYNTHNTDNTQTLPLVNICTEPQLLQSDSLIPAHAVRLSISDNGSGFPEHVLARMFEPYNSNKSNGTGLGLPIVKKIMDAHHAQISVKNLIEKSPPHTIIGAQIDILFINVANKESDKDTNKTTTSLL